jgi:hypothetical protein
MNSDSLEPTCWSKRDWAYAVGAAFVLQAGLIFCFARRELSPPERPPFETAIYLTANGPDTSTVNSVGFDDPTLLALPNLRGFSGAAWLKFPTLDYQPMEPPEPTNWLHLEEHTLGATFSQFVASNRAAPRLIADKPLPPLVRYEPNFPNEPAATQSRLRLQGQLANRPLLSPLALPSWPHAEILSNTVVQVAVDPDGMTFSPVLLSHSGLREADTFALDWAGGARFRPLPRETRLRDGTESLTWGKLVFQWHTVPLLPTNSPFATP